MEVRLASILNAACDLKYWREAENQARRSTLKTFKTGAVIFNHKTEEIVGKGCSHHTATVSANTCHAEQHALRDSYGARNYGENYHKEYELSIVIVTLGRSMNFAYSSRPCVMCAQQLAGNIGFVHYAERLNDGSWIVNSDLCRNLHRKIEHSKRVVRYARDGRLPPS